MAVGYTCPVLDVKVPVWTFPHYLRYLCAIIERLHPQVQGEVRAIIDAARAAAQEGTAVTIKHLRIDADRPSEIEKWNTIEEIANGICDIIDYWEPWEHELFDERFSYEAARDVANDAEHAALKHLTYEVLAECALEAFDTQLDDDHRDAAIAAMSVGHYDIGYKIINDG